MSDVGGKPANQFDCRDTCARLVRNHHSKLLRLFVVCTEYPLKLAAVLILVAFWPIEIQRYKGEILLKLSRIDCRCVRNIADE